MVEGKKISQLVWHMYPPTYLYSLEEDRTKKQIGEKKNIEEFSNYFK